MQNCKTLRQPFLGELARAGRGERRERGEENASYSGHLRLCQLPRAGTYSARTNTHFCNLANK
jgi:hypothetical protein